MTTTQEITKELFSDKVIEEVKKLQVSNKKVGALNSDLPLRLFKTEAGTINLELIIQREKETDILNEFGRLVNIYEYAQPIGYFTLHKGFFKTLVEITIIKQFESDYQYLIENKIINSTYKLNKLSLAENILIGAVSLEAAINAEKLEDCSFSSNCFEYDLYMTSDNEYPQCFLDDKYGVNGPIIGYLFREENRPINPMIEYKDIFHSLDKRGLLTAFRKF